jgi:glycosyltransferase involved in cell wall biosynthesis
MTSNPLRVVHFTPAPFPYQTPLFNAIAERVDLHVVYLSRPSQRSAGGLWASFDDPWGSKPTFDYLFAPSLSVSFRSLDFLASLPRGLGSVLNHQKPELVTVTGWALASAPAISWSRRHDVPRLMWTESSRLSGLLRDPLTNSYRRLLVQACDAWLAVGPAAVEFALELGASGERCIEACLPSAGSPGESASGALPQVGTRFRILWVGRLVSRKRPEVAIAAYRRIVSEIPEATLTIVGDGPLEDRVREAAARGGDGSIHVAGRVEGKALESIYRNHDVLLVTSVREVWGLVVNEALQNGLYVIASDQIGSARFLLEEETGAIVAADDVGAFGGALLSARAKVAMPGARARSVMGRVRECTVQAFADRYVEAAMLAASVRVGQKPVVGQ